MFCIKKGSEQHVQHVAVYCLAETRSRRVKEALQIRESQRLLLKVFLMRTRNDRDMYPMTPYTIPPGDMPIWRCRTHAVNVCSPRCYHIWMHPSWCCIQNQDASERMACRYWLQVYRWSYYLRSTCLWSSVKSNWSHDHRADSSWYWKHRPLWKRSHFLTQNLWWECTIS